MDPTHIVSDIEKNFDTPMYSLMRFPLGWVICSVIGRSGVPLSAMVEVTDMLSNENGKVMYIHHGIAHHLRETTVSNCVFVITGEADGVEWTDQITRSLENRPPADAWWYGTDVGLSAASIFSVLYIGDAQLKMTTRNTSKGAIPADSSDLGRCIRLLEKFPEWKTRLGEVALAYPGTKWSKIIDRWDKLESASALEQNAILREIN